jgi:hypothetical protein
MKGCPGVRFSPWTGPNGWALSASSRRRNMVRYSPSGTSTRRRVMPMRVVGRPAGDSEQVRLAQAGGLSGRAAVAPPPDDSWWGGLRAPTAQAWAAGQAEGQGQREAPGQAERQGHPDAPRQAERQRHPDAPRQVEGRVVEETGRRTPRRSHPPTPGQARRSPPGQSQRYADRAQTLLKPRSRVYL